MVIAIIIGLILLNGIFAMSEIALVSARRTSLSNDARRGNKSAKVALKLVDNPERFLSTVQVGITLIGILTGMYSGDVLAGDLALAFERLGMNAATAYAVAKITILIVVTYFTIVIGELVPKRIGMVAAEKISKIVARPMHWLSLIASPFVWALSKSTHAISKLLGLKNKGSKITEEEIKTLVREGMEGGAVKVVEQSIVDRVFSLGDRNLESIMTHRSDMVWLDVGMTPAQIMETIAANPFNKYPAADRSLDDIKGIVFLKDVFPQIGAEDFSLADVIRPAEFFYENMEVYEALEQMKQSHLTCALVIDEFGVVNGIVTLKDIMEALVGEMPDPGEEPDMVERADGSYLVDGQYSFYNFLERFDVENDSAASDFNTLGGLFLDRLGRIPKEGDSISWQGFEFEIMDMDGARIDKILVTPPSPSGETEQ